MCASATSTIPVEAVLDHYWRDAENRHWTDIGTLRGAERRVPTANRRYWAAVQNRGETSRRAKIVQKLRNRVNACNKKMIARPGTSYIQEMAFGVVDFLKVRVVSHGFDPCLQGQDFIVARGDNNRAKLKSLG